MATLVEPRALGFVRNRWVQLVVGIVGMVMIANLQYGWTLFVGPLDNKYHWGRSAIQVAFTTFVLFFFFQAEDGIRDGRVTGVQTCALPIFVLDTASLDHVTTHREDWE